nr:hypothetical protein [Tanacetum cinerariifolium]
TGSLSYEIQHFSSLTGLNLSFNQLDRSISYKLWELPRLQELDLSSNSLSGAISENIGKSNLWYIDLSNNSMEGIPFNADMSNLSKNVEYIDFSSCKLGPRFLEWIQKMKNLSYLQPLFKRLVLDKFYGPSMPDFPVGRLPPSTGFLGQLETLSLYNNHFSGEFPSSLENCTKLSLLDLGVKDFFGNIPVSIGKNLSRLYVLSLRLNNLFGTIPSQICQILRETELHHYQLSFDGIDHYSNGELKTIDLSSNNLTGQIPYELTYLQVLVVLDLSQYTLVGEIPQDIGQMKELLTLNLSRNMFPGEIPSTMSQMDRLNDLDVSYNNLLGRIPSSTQLQSFPPQRFTGNVRLCGLPTAKKMS